MDILTEIGWMKGQESSATSYSFTEYYTSKNV